MLRLAVKIAIVTGGARGIGRATAELFACEGAQSILRRSGRPNCSLWLTKAWRVGKPSSRSIRRVPFWGCVRSCRASSGCKTDCGVAPGRQTLGVNLDAHFLSAKHFVPRMRRNRWGRFVEISWNSAIVAADGLLACCAT